MNCGTCKHWDTKWYATDLRGADSSSPRYGTCRAVCHDHEEGAKAYTVDGSDYFSALRCSDAFGCVLWEASTAGEGK